MVVSWLNVSWLNERNFGFLMPHTREAGVLCVDMDARLREAIDMWDSRTPRRWLAKHGGLLVEKRTVLTLQYCGLRDEARALVVRRR